MPLTEQLAGLSEMGGADPAQAQSGLGGPGVDTPQEEKALEALTNAAVLIRQAAQIDPSIQYIADKILMDGFNQVMKHYGMEEEGKLALQQGMMEKKKADTLRRAGPPGGMGGASSGGAAPPMGPPIG